MFPKGHYTILHNQKLMFAPPSRRKIDFRLIPILAAIYTFALIDRTNIGAARISGIDAALDLKVGNRVSIASKSLEVEI